jgi:hypothetical protein
MSVKYEYNIFYIHIVSEFVTVDLQITLHKKRLTVSMFYFRTKFLMTSCKSLFAVTT